MVLAMAKAKKRQKEDVLFAFIRERIICIDFLLLKNLLTPLFGMDAYGQFKQIWLLGKLCICHENEMYREKERERGSDCLS